MGVKFVETSLRDGHQSLFATRMTTEDVLLALEEIDKAGYHLSKSGAGQLSMPVCGFERGSMGKAPAGPLSAKTRNCRCFSAARTCSDTSIIPTISSKFVEKSLANGIDIIRVFDALND